ncbi:MAG: response regulator transcription factor [Thermoguttaceae bacterium]|jgi:two-component system OmpR family response regulator
MADKEHILVVEDEEHLAMPIKYNLVAEGYRVTVCGDGRAAIKLLTDSSSDIDLVVLDLMLPGMSGYAVCESLRAIDQDMPVLILSARTLAEDRTRGFDVGANQYMSKPFDLDEFISRVRNLLAFSKRRGEDRTALQPNRVEQFEFAGAKIDFKTFEVLVKGESIRMTQLELTLLRYFIENQGRVIPRREILENVWGMPGSINTRAPDQFIRRLRKIFEPDPAQPRHFLTIRDAGYRFIPDEA